MEVGVGARGQVMSICNMLAEVSGRMEHLWLVLVHVSVSLCCMFCCASILCFQHYYLVLYSWTGGSGRYEAPFLDLNLCISNGTVTTKIYD